MVAAGVYSFAAVDAGASVLISYGFIPAAINNACIEWVAERYRYRFVFLKDQSDIIQQEHRSIIDACQAQDPKALRDAIVNHMQKTLEGIQTYMNDNHHHKG